MALLLLWPLDGSDAHLFPRIECTFAVFVQRLLLELIQRRPDLNRVRHINCRYNSRTCNVGLRVNLHVMPGPRFFPKNHINPPRSDQ